MRHKKLCDCCEKTQLELVFYSPPDEKNFIEKKGALPGPLTITKKTVEMTGGKMIFLRELGIHVVACDGCIENFGEPYVALQLVAKPRLIDEAINNWLVEYLSDVNRMNEVLRQINEYYAKLSQLGEEMEFLMQNITLLMERARELTKR